MTRSIAISRQSFLASLLWARRRVVGTLSPHTSRWQKSLGSPGSWDDGWTRALSVHHRFVVDCTDPDVASLDEAVRVYTEYRKALEVGASDIGLVLVVRQRAVPMVLTDRAWQRLRLGDQFGITDPHTLRPAQRNIFISRTDGDGPDPSPTVTALQRAGAIILVCDIAARTLFDPTKPTPGMNDYRSYLLPDVIPQVSGVYALLRAQEVGCIAFRP